MEWDVGLMSVSEAIKYAGPPITLCWGVHFGWSFACWINDFGHSTCFEVASRIEITIDADAYYHAHGLWPILKVL